MDKLVDARYINTFQYVHGDKEEEYSWWNYRFGARTKNVGWRIDYFFVSNDLAECLEDTFILQEVTEGPVGIRIAL